MRARVELAGPLRSAPLFHPVAHSCRTWPRGVNVAVADEDVALRVQVTSVGCLNWPLMAGSGGFGCSKVPFLRRKLPFCARTPSQHGPRIELDDHIRAFVHGPTGYRLLSKRIGVRRTTRHTGCGDLANVRFRPDRIRELRGSGAVAGPVVLPREKTKTCFFRVDCHSRSPRPDTGWGKLEESWEPTRREFREPALPMSSANATAVKGKWSARIKERVKQPPEYRRSHDIKSEGAPNPKADMPRP